MTQRFELHGQDLVRDARTGLVWPRSANPLGYPVPWAEALSAVADLNRARYLGCEDWRMPNRVELRSLVDHARRQPALPPGHPFREVFLGWYWTSTTNAGQSAYAWNVHLEGGRMFYSRKDEFRLLWPVRGGSSVLPRTGQSACFDAAGVVIPCAGDGVWSGQDGAQRRGAPWPEPRFETAASGVLDRLTGLEWASPHRLPPGLHDWAQALRLAAGWSEGGAGWRLPEITELESLLDADRANPALPPGLATGLANTQGVTVDGFWSATVSGFDAAWAFVLYVQKGAVGVGFKAGKEFAVWPVRGG